MTRYVAFLHGIMAGGRSLILVEDLRAVFFSMGFGNASTYKATTNLIFDSNEPDPSAIEQRIRRELSAFAGSEIGVFVRTMDQIVEISKFNPFRTTSLGGAEAYVAFLSSEPTEKPQLPVESPKKDVRIFELAGKEAYYMAKKAKGKAEFPNQFVEESLKTKATSRTWEIVKGIADLPK
jgi:uncharacterized protein (DUF1697 family)